MGALFHPRPALAGGYPTPMSMAAKREDERDDDEPNHRHDPAGVDVPGWVLAAVVLIVGVSFFLTVIRAAITGGSIDPEMYGLVAIVLTGARALDRWRWKRQ